MNEVITAAWYGVGFGLGLLAIQFVCKSPLRLLIVCGIGFFLFFGKHAKAEGLAGGETRTGKAKVEAVGSVGSFTQSFRANWRRFGLDDLGEGGESKPAKDFAQPLPVTKLAGNCGGIELYWFDFAGYRVLGVGGQVVEMAPGYTGSAGTRAILFGLDVQTKKLKVLFDENVLEFRGLGEISQGCPAVRLRMYEDSVERLRSRHLERVSTFYFDRKKGRFNKYLDKE